MYTKPPWPTPFRVGQRRVGEQAAGERSPDPGQSVRRERADRVVEHLLDRQHAEHDDDPGDEADDRGRPGVDVSRRSGDRDQRGDRPVAGHADVGLAGPEPDRRQRSEHPAGGGDVGDQDDVGEADIAGMAGNGAQGAERRTGVEPEPAEPEDEGGQADERHAVARDHVRLAVRRRTCRASARAGAGPRARRWRRSDGPPWSRRSPASPGWPPASRPRTASGRSAGR